MTNKEYITAFLGRFVVSAEVISATLYSSDLDPNEDVDVDLAKVFMYTNAPSMLPVYRSVSELGVSISYNLEAFKVWYASLCKELGKPNLIEIARATSSITDATDMY